jgi:hypothetical protein
MGLAYKAPGFMAGVSGHGTADVVQATTPTLPDWLPDPTSDAWKRDTDAGKDQKPDPQREARDEAVGRAIKHSP